MLATAADVAAIRWVERETPPQAAFLINARYWQHDTYVGSDGGYWLTPLAGRRTLPPPVLYNQAAASDVLRVNQFAARLADPALDAATLAQLMAAEGLTHVFLGRLGRPADAQEPGGPDVFRARVRPRRRLGLRLLD